MYLNERKCLHTAYILYYIHSQYLFLCLKTIKSFKLTIETIAENPFLSILSMLAISIFRAEINMQNCVHIY